MALLRRPGERLQRDELLDLVWGHRHVTPGVHTRAIEHLRHALADDPHNPRYLQTPHAMGHRFIRALDTGNGTTDLPPGPAPGAEAEPPTAPARRHDPAAADSVPTTKKTPT